MVARVTEVTLSTLNARISPDVIDVVQPVKVVLCPLIAEDVNGFADPVIVSATVGG